MSYKMPKIPIRIIILSILGLFVSLLNFSAGSITEPFFLIRAMVYLFLSVALLFLLNWIRVITIFYSILTILEYIPLLYIGMEGMKRGGKDAFLAMGFLFNLPGLFFSILALHYLNMKTIRMVFKR